MRDKINSDMIDAMKNQDKKLLAVIRMVKSQIQLEEISLKRNLNDEEIITIISKQIKMRNDSISEFEKGNRQDLIDKTNEEIEILKVYLPEQIPQNELEEIIDKIISNNNITTSKQIGLLMKELIPIIKGKADMKIVNEMIKNKLD